MAENSAFRWIPEQPKKSLSNPYWTKARCSVQSGAKASSNRTVKIPKMASPCKHPRVRVVSRQEDVEYVECVECGEVFDSDEFRDMEIEEKVSATEDDEPDD